MTDRLNPLYCLVFVFPWLSLAAQDSAPGATVGASIGGDGAGRIVVEARGEIPKPPVFYKTRIESLVTVNRERVETEATFEVDVLQGEAGILSVVLIGEDRVISVTGDTVTAWSVRKEGAAARSLEVSVKKPDPAVPGPHRFSVHLQSERVTALPAPIGLTHFAPGGKTTAGFQEVVTLAYAGGAAGRVTEVEGFLPLAGAPGAPLKFQTATGGKLVVQVNRSGATPEPVELSSVVLSGTVNQTGKTVDFKLGGIASVSEAGAEITILKGSAAVTEMPVNPGYRLVLAEENGGPVLRLVFPAPGEFPVEIAFVAAITVDGLWRRLDFTVGSGAVTPVSLAGLAADTEFSKNPGEVTPEQNGAESLGFLPAGGRASLAWKSARKAGSGKLFFTTNARVEAQLGAGLLRQDHQIDYRILQGEIAAMVLDIDGAGEVSGVEGNDIAAWKVVAGAEGARRLEVSLSRPVTDAATLRVRTQTPLDAFPVKVKATRLTPQGAVRHAGHLRLSNLGSVRLDPAAAGGLAQLAPEQYPGDPLEARQLFVYRFPSADYDLEIAADRVQPEVGISQLVTYEVTETDRRINADIELDIREAPVREWALEIPGDYSAVAVTGAAVADYLVSAEPVNGRKKLTLIFSGEVEGRQLATLVLEKSEAAVAGAWVLPRLEFPEAKSVRGDIGVAGAPGFRVETETTNLLVEKPLSYFPKPTPRLQQAFRIREPEWTATMQVEPLEKSVQADVFHLYSLTEGTAYASVVLNYFVTGAPVSEWSITVPEALGNVSVEGQNVRTWRREGDTLHVSLHQPVIGPSTLLVTFEETIASEGGRLIAGRVSPLGVRGERGYIEVVSAGQVKVGVATASQDLLALDPLELPAEFRLLSAAPSQGVWQYTGRPFELAFDVGWYEPGTTMPQAVEFADVTTRVTEDGEAVTDLVYYVKSRSRTALELTLPASTRLWSVTVDGQTVNARRTEEITLIPLPGSTDPDIPVIVQLRLGREAGDGSSIELALPRVAAPVLKTEWNLSGEADRVLFPNGGNVAPPMPVLPATGFARLARHGLGALTLVLLVALAGVILSRSDSRSTQVFGLVAFATAALMALWTALAAGRVSDPVGPLRISLPMLAAEVPVELSLRSVPGWQVDLSWPGVVLGLAGLIALVWGYRQMRREGDEGKAPLIIAAGAAAFFGGLLWQRGSDDWFFALFAILILVGMLWPRARGWWRDRPVKEVPRKTPVSPVVATILMVGALLTGLTTRASAEVVPSGFSVIQAIQQKAELRHEEGKLRVSGIARFAGKEGDTFLLLRAPAVMTQFDGEGLKISRQSLDGNAEAKAYLVTITGAGEGTMERVADFSYELAVPDPTAGILLPTGAAALSEIELRHDRPGWEFYSGQTVRASDVANAAKEESAVTLLLAPGAPATISLRPKIRDVTMEETRFYVEGDQLFTPGPGVLDGRHRFRVRPSQGQVSAMTLRVPAGLTVSEVTGPVGSWQFDADAGVISMTVEPPQSVPFEVLVETQRGLETLPVALDLAPVRVDDAAGEVGLVALAFGPEAQPENAEATGMSAVNAGDFDATLIPEGGAILHRVFRYGAEEGKLSVRVNPVEPEVKVTSRQVISLGDERVVLGIEFTVEITRAGLFQLGFPLPDGLEVESLTGAALQQWSEVSVSGKREVVLHLNGRTLGEQAFSLTLAGTAPPEEGDWVVPRFVLNDATRQSGDLIVRPAEGIRLRSVARQNLSELDPRELGGEAKDALAFRLLQRDWNLTLGIEKLEPWITGQVLHASTLREGQTRTALTGVFKVENAAIRELRVRLPLLSEDEIRTLRASGPAVGDLVRVAPDSDLWDIRFQRRLIGEARVTIDYERRGERVDGKETLTPVEFPSTRQLAYFVAVRSAGRLELEAEELPKGWQPTEWSAVPTALREAGGDQASPALALRATATEAPAVIRAQRHSLAESLKLRVSSGKVTTVLSSAGDELTSVDLAVEVVQRGSLTVGLPPGGELFHLFVNGESVHSVREGDAWQFYILPGSDDRTAQVRFAYVVPAAKAGRRAGRVVLTSPALAVPVENLVWDVVAPPGMELTHNDGDLEPQLVESRGIFDRTRYVAEAGALREDQNKRATDLLERANELIQSGDQTRARQALSGVANGFAIDAASNEDARIQLENLRTQQAVVGLNTRRQRLVLDNEAEGSESGANDQLKQGAAANPVLQGGELNFRPQELVQLLQGNSDDDNAVLQRIAGKIVRQQQAQETVARPMGLVLPAEGLVYRFQRALQVAENAPLELDLTFAPEYRVAWWRVMLVLVLIAGATVLFSAVVVRRGRG